MLKHIDKPWKATLISVITSAIFSTLLSYLITPSGYNALIGLFVGTIMALFISHPISKIIFHNLNLIREQNVRLQELNSELDTYAHTVAHNIRDAINTISLSGEHIMILTEPDSKIHNRAETITEVAHNLSDTVNSLLLLASIRDESVPIVPINTANLIPRVHNRLESAILQYEAQIEYPDQWQPAVGYEPWLVEVWINLLSNAIKYGGNQAPIICGSSVDEDSKTRFWIKDQGRGLTTQEQTQLFQPFSQLERIEGHGLGLSIASRIVSRLDGTIGVESAGKGLGCTFYFTLPTAQTIE